MPSGYYYCEKCELLVPVGFKKKHIKLFHKKGFFHFSATEKTNEAKERAEKQ